MKPVSIIIPTTNSTFIEKIIIRLKHQTVDMSLVEVLIVGVDELGLIVEDDLVRFIPTEKPGYASDKRNIGIELAQGDILLFLDDDCLPATDWLEQHLYRHQQGEKVVGGAITFNTDHYLQLVDNVSAFHDMLPFTKNSLRSYLTTANLSVHKEVVEKVGPLESRKNRAEDLEWTVRFRLLGYNLYFEPNALVLHDPNRRSFYSVWQHWLNDAPDTIRVRLRYTDLLRTPRLAQHRSLFFLGAPLIAGWATAYTFKYWKTVQQYWHTIPVVYLTKLAWCWGAFKYFPTSEELK